MVTRILPATPGRVGTLSPRVPTAAAAGSITAGMRIAIVTDFYYPSLGGITEHVDGQARSLTELGHEVTVVTGRLLQPAKVQDDALTVPEPTFEIARMGTALRLYMPKWGNGAETTHTVGPRLGRRVGAFFRSR